METPCGFLNGSGGRSFFGVTNAGRVIGRERTDPTFQEVANAIRKREPTARIEQSRIPVGGAKEVLMLASGVEAGPAGGCSLMAVARGRAEDARSHAGDAQGPLAAETG